MAFQQHAIPPTACPPAQERNVAKPRASSWPPSGDADDVPSMRFQKLMEGLVAEFERLESECYNLRHGCTGRHSAELPGRKVVLPLICPCPGDTSSLGSLHERVKLKSLWTARTPRSRSSGSGSELSAAPRPPPPTSEERSSNFPAPPLSPGRLQVDVEVPVEPEDSCSPSPPQGTMVPSTLGVEALRTRARRSRGPGLAPPRGTQVMLPEAESTLSFGNDAQEPAEQPYQFNITRLDMDTNATTLSSNTASGKVTPPSEGELDATLRKGHSQNFRGSIFWNAWREKLGNDTMTRTRSGILLTTELSPSQILIQNMLVNPAFDQVIGAIILLDGLLLGLESQHELSPMLTTPWLTVIEIMSLLFRVIFFIELMLRFFGETVRGALQNSWTRFDTGLVVFSFVEAFVKYSANAEMGPITIVRVCRLARLARAARLMVQFRTLWVLVAGLRASFSTVMWTFLLIAAIGYVFAILGMEAIPLRDNAGTVRQPPILDDLGEILEDRTNYQVICLKNFGSFSDSMLTLLQVLTLDSIAAIYRPLVMQAPSVQGHFNLIFFLLFIFFVSISLMNLVTAVMVEGALKQATADKDSEQALEEQRKRQMMPKLRDMFIKLDEDGSGEVSMQEIRDAPTWLTDEMKKITTSDDLQEIFELLDYDDSGFIHIDEFLEGIFKASKGDVLTKLQLGRLVRQCGQMKTALFRIARVEAEMEMRMTHHDSKAFRHLVDSERFDATATHDSQGEAQHPSPLATSAGRGRQPRGEAQHPSPLATSAGRGRQPRGEVEAHRPCGSSMHDWDEGEVEAHRPCGSSMHDWDEGEVEAHRPCGSSMHDWDEELVLPPEAQPETISR
eukprot:TRINITY_DN3131_c0_g1_i5.p1 TRINITY_DN3131_c0_g1~~TRINITY_DN3131_c0_g1_i5.p1  ORF type:complete len:845 (+),score=115.89 TRINITY_DN3131_c0_g1_i5:27-2561(+)